jgi:hypothetical protein
VAGLEEGVAAVRGVVLAVAAARLGVAYEDVDRREGLALDGADGADGTDAAGLSGLTLADALDADSLACLLVPAARRKGVTRLLRSLFRALLRLSSCQGCARLRGGEGVASTLDLPSLIAPRSVQSSASSSPCSSCPMAAFASGIMPFIMVPSIVSSSTMLLYVSSPAPQAAGKGPLKGGIVVTGMTKGDGGVRRACVAACA